MCAPRTRRPWLINTRLFRVFDDCKLQTKVIYIVFKLKQTIFTPVETTAKVKLIRSVKHCNPSPSGDALVSFIFRMTVLRVDNFNTNSST